MLSQCTNSPAKWIALTPRWVIEECASKPVNLVTYICAALWAWTTVIMVGSPMMMARGLGTSRAMRGGERVRADAAHLLVVGEREVDRFLEAGVQEMR